MQRFTTPRKPTFVIYWQKAGRIDSQLSILYHSGLQAGRGIYIIFTTSAGKAVPQYVGMTFGQTFAKRIGQHLKSVERLGVSFRRERYLCVGTITPVKYKTLSRKMVAEIESYLIWAMKPQGNRSQRTPYQGREMLIHNSGANFGLPLFLYVCPMGISIVTAQGPSLDQMTTKVVNAFPW